MPHTFKKKEKENNSDRIENSQFTTLQVVAIFNYLVFLFSVTHGRFICVINLKKRDYFLNYFFIFLKIYGNYIFFFILLYICLNNYIHYNFFTKEYER